MIKAISLWQPWATLVATNWKHYETRSWATPYRGALVIHAAKRTEEVDLYFSAFRFKERLNASGYQKWQDLPLGAALGVVELVNCVRTENIRHRLSPDELAFGNYQDGRWAWELKFCYRFNEPLPMRGAQGLFPVGGEIEEDYINWKMAINTIVD